MHQRLLPELELQPVFFAVLAIKSNYFNLIYNQHFAEYKFKHFFAMPFVWKLKPMRLSVTATLGAILSWSSFSAFVFQ